MVYILSCKNFKPTAEASEEPVNKNMEKQCRLFSTKKKTKSSNTWLSKSITAEQMSFSENLKDLNLPIENINTYLDHIY